MDDELLFVVSGFSSKSVKTWEESLKQLTLNRSWVTFVVNNAKQRTQLLQGIANTLSHVSASQDGLANALILLQLIQEIGKEVFASPSDSPLMKRIVPALVRCLLLEGTMQRSCLVLTGLTSVGMDSASSIRCEIEPLVNEVVRSLVDCLEQNGRGIEQQQSMMLKMVENFAFESKSLGKALGTRIGPVIVQNFSKFPHAALRALMNLTNCQVEVGRLVVEEGAVDLITSYLRLRLPVYSPNEDLADMDPADFDCVITSLSVLCNLVELSETGATAKLAQSPSNVELLYQCYTMALPLRVQNDLRERPAGDTVEAEWTPESLVVSAYVCLVIGCLVRDSREAGEVILRNVPGGSQRGFSPMVLVLETFKRFQQDAGVLTQEALEVIARVAQFLNDANNRSMLPPSSLVAPDQLNRKRRMPPPSFAARSSATDSGGLLSVEATTTSGSTATTTPTLAPKRSSPLRDKRG